VGDDELREERREARREAVWFAVAIFVANVLLAFESHRADWELFGSPNWWVWLLFAAPSALLGLTLFLGSRRLGLERTQREVAIALLSLLGLGTAAATACVVVSLTRWAPTGMQLLATTAVVLLTNMITFGLAFWELDDGGPVARATAARRAHPDFQFPQDENPGLASQRWEPALVDYVYVAVTNSMAFSPTDAMPLTHRAKLLMGLESVISATTVLVVGARAINVLG
jgi:hypothetical protein